MKTLAALYFASIFVVPIIFIIGSIIKDIRSNIRDKKEGTFMPGSNDKHRKSTVTNDPASITQEEIERCMSMTPEEMERCILETFGLYAGDEDPDRVEPNEIPADEAEELLKNLSDYIKTHSDAAWVEHQKLLQEERIKDKYGSHHEKRKESLVHRILRWFYTALLNRCCCKIAEAEAKIETIHQKYPDYGRRPTHLDTLLQGWSQDVAKYTGKMVMYRMKLNQLDSR